MIRKAVIPIAGKATRLMPVSSVVPKAMFPLVTGPRIRSVLHEIIEQAVNAGAEYIAVIASPDQIDIVTRYMAAIGDGDFGRLPARIEYITQHSPVGFGHAVLQSRSFVDDEPFLLFLGDHVYIQESGAPPCPAQVAEAFDRFGGSAMIGVQTAATDELSRVGVAAGIRLDKQTYRCTCFVEKPDITTAGRLLVTEGLPPDTFLAHCGIYAFSPEIFDCLRQVETAANSGQEIELAAAQTLLLQQRPEGYRLCRIAGRAYDIGTPHGYALAQAAFSIGAGDNSVPGKI